MAQGIFSDPRSYISKDSCSCMSCHSVSRSHHHQDHYTEHSSYENLQPGHIEIFRSCFDQIARSNLRPELLQAPHNRCPSTHNTHLSYLQQPTPVLPCCDQHGSSSNQHQHPHRQHRIYEHRHSLRPDQQPYHTPHYAQAFSPPPLVHASWEPTRETGSTHAHSHMSDHLSELDRHYHYHQHNEINRRAQHAHHPDRNHRHTPYPQDYASRQEHTHGHNRFEQELPSLALHYQILRQRLEGDLNYLHNIAYTTTSSSRTTPWRHHQHHHLSSPPPRGVPIVQQQQHRHRFIPPLFTVTDSHAGEFLEPRQHHHHHHHHIQHQHQQNGSESSEIEPKGLSQQDLDKLPSYIIKKKTLEEFSENDRCVVCMCEYEVDEQLRILPCAHEFHAPCVDKWLSTNPTCPICRAVCN